MSLQNIARRFLSNSLRLSCVLIDQFHLIGTRSQGVPVHVKSYDRDALQRILPYHAFLRGYHAAVVNPFRYWVTSTASSGNLLLVFLRCVLIFVGGNRVEPPSADTRSETENIEPILHRIISRKMLGYLVLYGLDGGSSKLRRPTGSAFFSRNRLVVQDQETLRLM